RCDCHDRRADEQAQGKIRDPARAFVLPPTVQVECADPPTAQPEEEQQKVERKHTEEHPSPGPVLRSKSRLVGSSGCSAPCSLGPHASPHASHPLASLRAGYLPLRACWPRRGRVLRPAFGRPVDGSAGVPVPASASFPGSVVSCAAAPASCSSSASCSGRTSWTAWTNCAIATPPKSRTRLSSTLRATAASSAPRVESARYSCARRR